MSNEISGTLSLLKIQTQETSLSRKVEATTVKPKVLVHGSISEKSATVDALTKRRELQQALESLHEHAKKSNYSLSFTVDDASDYVVIKIRDANNGEVVRQIPNDTILRVSHYFKGLLKDEKI